MINAAIACCVVFLVVLISSYWWGGYSRLTLGERLKDAKDELNEREASGHDPARSESLVFDYIFERNKDKPANAPHNAAKSTQATPSQLVNLKDRSEVKPAVANQRLNASETQRDDLKKIWGIGVVYENLLNEFGITTFNQLANISDNDKAKVRESLGVYSGRIEKDNWISQAIELHKFHYSAQQAA